MIAIAFIIVFLFVGWIFLQFPLSEYETIELTFCMVAGLTAVAIIATAMIMSKLTSIQKLLEENKNKEKNPPEKEKEKTE